MFGSKMGFERRHVGIDFVEQDAIALTFGLENVELEASRLGSDRGIRIGIDQATECGQATWFEAKIDDDRKQHYPTRLSCFYAAMRHSRAVPRHVAENAEFEQVLRPGASRAWE